MKTVTKIYLVADSDGWGHSIPLRTFTALATAIRWAGENGCDAGSAKEEDGGTWVPKVNRSGGFWIEYLPHNDESKL